MRQAFHWGAPLAVSVLAVWLALGADRSEQASRVAFFNIGPYASMLALTRNSGLDPGKRK